MSIQIGAILSETDGKGVLWVLDFCGCWTDGTSFLLTSLQTQYQETNPTRHVTRKSATRIYHYCYISTVLFGWAPSTSLVQGRSVGPGSLHIKYFTECLNGDSRAVQTLLDRIRENPVVEGSCYLPLNASIVVNSFLSDNHSLPTSNHGIFKSVVQSSLKKYLQDKLGKSTPVGNITSPDSLPLKIRAPFVQMCHLAYHGIDRNKAMFTNEDIWLHLRFLKDILYDGLIQTVPSIVGAYDGRLVYYSFLHMSIQELLAAIHISRMSSKNKISLFQNMFGKPQFSAVFQFYAGITKLSTTRFFLSKVPRFLCPVP